MKTTKRKGFTLIELIVVIAIIGVLAAILVPTMLGYVRKSKLSSANSSASSVYKAINSALTELDEEGVDIGDDLYIKYTPAVGATAGQWSTSSTNDLESTLGDGGSGKFDTKVANFFADIDKVKQGAQAVCTNGGCVAVAVASDSTYTGTYPSGVVTSDNYTEYKTTSSSDGSQLALKDAVLVAAGVVLEDVDASHAAGARGSMPTGHAYSTVYSAIQ